MISLPAKLIPIAAMRRLSELEEGAEASVEVKKAAKRIRNALELDESPGTEDLGLVMLHLLVEPRVTALAAATATAAQEPQRAQENAAAPVEAKIVEARPPKRPGPSPHGVGAIANGGPTHLPATIPTPAKKPSGFSGYAKEKKGGEKPGRMEGVRVLRVEHTRVRIPLNPKLPPPKPPEKP